MRGKVAEILGKLDISPVVDLELGKTVMAYHVLKRIGEAGCHEEQWNR